MVSSLEKSHISSLVVQCLPKCLVHAMQTTSKINQVEVHADDSKSKFIALLETAHEKDILAIIDIINAIEGVLSTTMVYHEIDYSL